MRRKRYSSKAVTVALSLALGGLLAAHPAPAGAEAADGPSLIISQLKVTSTDGQFVTLYNATDSRLDMSGYRLEYFNSYDLDKATSSRLIALSGTVPPHGYYMVNDDSLLLCYRLTVDSMSLGLSSTAGMVEVVSVDQAGAGDPALSVLQDFAAWSKKSAPGVVTMPDDGGFLQRQPYDGHGDPLVTTPGDGSWQAVKPADGDPCELTGTNSGSILAPPSAHRLLPSIGPPVTILPASDLTSSDPVPVMPPSDIGLMVPVVNEILPNPAGTGNDSMDEFIELYNPNPKAFDLSGFSLQTGIKTLHTYTFPKGAGLPARSFKAFYSSTTKLSLSNTQGMVKLLDPFGNGISATAAYSKAKDGISWALARGRWFWTTDTTPGAANIIKQPPVKQSLKSKKRKKTGTGGDAGNITDVRDVSASPGDNSGPIPGVPVHTGTLVLVAGLALLYGAYEYRADLANFVYKHKRHIGAGHADRS